MTAQDNGLKLSVTIDVVIRKAQQDDLEKLEWYGQFTHFRRLFRRSFEDQRLGKRLLLVADVNGFPVGRLFVQLYSENGVLADGTSKGYLYSLHVMEMFRGHGIGSRLIHIAEQVLRNKHYSYATIAVAKENEGALRLYQRHDYHIFDENDGRWRYTDHQGKTHDIYEPCYLLEKKL